MKIKLAILIVYLLFSSAFARQKSDVDNVIKKTSELLNKLKNISYSSYREINNYNRQFQKLI